MNLQSSWLYNFGPGNKLLARTREQPLAQILLNRIGGASKVEEARDLCHENFISRQPLQNLTGSRVQSNRNTLALGVKLGKII
jgi:hypothetical protein